ncbi:MAG: Ig-like domain-containing protein, partial [Nocardioidaceae bacterium]
AWAPWAGAGPKGCKPRNCTTADTTRPSVAITEPAAGATVAGAVAVRGTASDNATVSRVDVAVDGQAPVRATGTTGWSLPLDTTRYADGAHTVTATAVDGSGNATTTSMQVSVQNTVAPPPPPPPSGDLLVDDVVVQDPKAANPLVLLGRGRIATAGTREVVLYWEEMTYPSRIVAHVKDTSTGAVVLVDLPSTSGPWSNPSAVLTTSGDLWILAGSAPVWLRQYRLSGSPLPTSAALVSSRTFGDSDSRMGTLLQLVSGAIVAVWHQQGSTGPQGHGIAYRRTDGSWQEQFQGFTKTTASKDTLVQHPADGSVWLFNNADALGTIAAAHFTEIAGGLRMDWADWSFIDGDHGEFNSDPENPDVVAVADPSAGDVVVAYQSSHRLRFSSTVIGSYPAIARLRADGTMTFTHLPVWVSRVSWLGLSLRAGEVWLAHRVVNPNDLSTDNLELRRLKGGTWSETRSLGKATTPVAAPLGASFAFNTTDDALHLARAR